MNFKAIHSYYRFTGLTAICLFTIGTGLTSPAHAANFSFSEVQAGDPGRNNTAATADATNIVLPAFNDAVSIDGTLATAGDEDWFSFTINQTGTLAVSFTSASFPPPGEPKPTLEGFLYLAGTTPTLLQSLSFQPPGGNGSLVPGSYSAGSLFLVQVLGTGAYPRNYNYKAELQAAPPPPPPPVAVPTPALLPGLIGMGVAAWRKRQGESTVSPEVIKA